MKYMMHCADISNSSKSLDLCKKWTYRVMEEFFLQVLMYYRHLKACWVSLLLLFIA